MPDYIDVHAFEPYAGGAGVTIAVTTSASTPVGLPGSGDVSQPGQSVKIRVINEGSVVGLVQLGGLASLSSMAILPGTVEMFTIPFSSSGVVISAITRSGATTISATAGRGF